MNGLFFMMLVEQPVIYVLTVLATVFSICVHECAHSVAALLEGDDTGKRLGFLSMNPLVVMGWQSLILLLVFGIAYGRVPVNGSRMRHRWSQAWVSFAGPLSNLLLALLGTFLFGTLFRDSNSWGGMACLQFAYLNIWLFLFNLLPVPPLDGWGIVEKFIPKEQWNKISEDVRGVLFLSIFMLFMIPGFSHRLSELVMSIVVRMVELFV